MKVKQEGWAKSKTGAVSYRWMIFSPVPKAAIMTKSQSIKINPKESTTEKQ